MSCRKSKDVEWQFKRKHWDLFSDAGKENKSEAECLKEDVHWLKVKNAKLLERIGVLQDALYSKVLQAGLIISAYATVMHCLLYHSITIIPNTLHWCYCLYICKLKLPYIVQ